MGLRLWNPGNNKDLPVVINADSIAYGIYIADNSGSELRSVMPPLGAGDKGMRLTCGGVRVFHPPGRLQPTPA